jgi:hypothetical protein
MYYRKVKRGENPYPAKRPWYPHTPEESYTELFAGIDQAYPYPVKALILYFGNPVLSVNAGTKFVEVLRDTKKLPLFIGITTHDKRDIPLRRLHSPRHDISRDGDKRRPVPLQLWYG